MPVVHAPILVEAARSILVAHGTPGDLAGIVAESLVEANLVGHDSHGVIRLEPYCSAVQQGQVQPAARPTLARQFGATGVVDAAQGWGQPAARMAAQLVGDLAEQYGVGAVTIANATHIGRLGEYVEVLAHRNLIGIAVCNAGRAVAPYGGTQRMLGTNPFACAVPRGDGHAPILVDFATSVVAEGKLKVARAKGEQVAPGLFVDRNGQPSTNPEDYYAGGALLPVGGHKGYGLSVMIELLGGALSGRGPSALPEYQGGNGTLLIALSISPFIAPEQLLDQANRLAELLGAVPPAPGFSGVLVPGEPERLARAQRLRDGIDLPERVWAMIEALAQL